MKETPEVNYVPTVEGLKALYEHHGKAMGLMLESIFTPSAPGKVGEKEKQTDE